MEWGTALTRIRHVTALEAARSREHNACAMSTPTLSTPTPKSSLTPAAILELGLGFWGSKTLLSAIELGVFTELAKGPLTQDELSQRLGLHQRSARDFLDALVTPTRAFTVSVVG